MTILVTILATLGFLALLRQWFRAAFRTVRGNVELYVGRTTEDVRAQRGDITGLEEIREVNRRMMRTRARAVIELAGYTALLATPLLTVWGKTIYALCAALWLLEAIPPKRPPQA